MDESNRLDDIEYLVEKPVSELSDFVESFWMLANHSDEQKDLTVLPDGRIDLSFHNDEPYEAFLIGLETEPSQGRLPAKGKIFVVSFKLLAIEYIFNESFPSLLNSAFQLSPGYLGIGKEDLEDFGRFCSKATTALLSILKKNVDEKKRRLFQLIYESHGALSVDEMSKAVNWNSRQINRYFNQRFGISLKAYCNILRFRASFNQIGEGKLYPEQNFTDQAHFIKDVKKYSGVTPKELSKNSSGRFIQFSLLFKKKQR